MAEVDTGVTRPDQAAPVNMDYFALSRAIAYKGKIGRAREAFCREYINRKKTALQAIEQDQTEKITAQGEKITCHRGCANCCTQYILGTLQECEAIVYYLHQHQEVLDDFIRTYPVWRDAVRKYDTAFQAVKEAVDRQIREGVTEDNTRAYDTANTRFLMLNIPCPFLSREGVCSIHEVRPWNCAKPVVTTPKEWCSPYTNKNNDEPKIYVSDLVPEEMPYFRPTKVLNVTLVHLGVWQILTEGYLWLSDVPGLEGLSKETMLDPEVQEVVGRFIR